MKKPGIKTAAKALFYVFLIFSGTVAAVNFWIGYSTERFIFNAASGLPSQKTGLLLGTAPFLKGGGRNPFFENRIDAALELYNKGKILNIIASGDNRTQYYNEPEEMRRGLVKRGIPAERIYLDYAGLRTLDSVVRCGEIFGQKSFTIISQRFQNQRAIFLARAKGYDAVGFNAEDIAYLEAPKTRFREYFARLQAFYDLLTYKEPRFLGEKTVIKQ